MKGLEPGGGEGGGGGGPPEGERGLPLGPPKDLKIDKNHPGEASRSEKHDFSELYVLLG